MKGQRRAVERRRSNMFYISCHARAYVGQDDREALVLLVRGRFAQRRDHAANLGVQREDIARERLELVEHLGVVKVDEGKKEEVRCGGSISKVEGALDAALHICGTRDTKRVDDVESTRAGSEPREPSRAYCQGASPTGRR